MARAAAALGEAGLLHRDIKPDNILFLRGRPLLADVSLLDTDTIDRTELGTPGYRAPSWFTETGGNPDLYGLAATLFTALTGHAPDKLGRAAYRWPPGGEASLSPAERAAWLRLHRVILRATHEHAAERFHTLTVFADALENGAMYSHSLGRDLRIKIIAGGVLGFIGLLCGYVMLTLSGALDSSQRPTIQPPDWTSFDKRLENPPAEINSDTRRIIELIKSNEGMLAELSRSKNNFEAWSETWEKLWPEFSLAVELHSKVRVMHKKEAQAIALELERLALNEQNATAVHLRATNSISAANTAYNFLMRSYTSLYIEIYEKLIQQTLDIEANLGKIRHEKLDANEKQRATLYSGGPSLNSRC